MWGLGTFLPWNRAAGFSVNSSQCPEQGPGSPSSHGACSLLPLASQPVALVHVLPRLLQGNSINGISKGPRSTRSDPGPHCARCWRKNRQCLPLRAHNSGALYLFSLPLLLPSFTPLPHPAQAPSDIYAGAEVPAQADRPALAPVEAPALKIVQWRVLASPCTQAGFVLGAASPSHCLGSHCCL